MRSIKKRNLKQTKIFVDIPLLNSIPKRRNFKISPSKALSFQLCDRIDPKLYYYRCNKEIIHIDFLCLLLEYCDVCPLDIITYWDAALPKIKTHGLISWGDIWIKRKDAHFTSVKRDRHTKKVKFKVELFKLNLV